MKKIGVLYGNEKTFPPAVIERINDLKPSGIKAEEMKVGTLNNDDAPGYYVIFDRISNHVPYYISVLKNATLNGCRVVNNPFWSCAEDHFFYASLAKKIGIQSPRTTVLPSKEHPHGAVSETLRNLIYPLDWDSMFEYVGFPAYIKPNKGNGFYNAYKVYSPQEFFSAYDLTGDRIMIFQEAIDYDEYFRCYVIGRKKVRIMKYDPMTPQHLRYDKNPLEIDDELKLKIEKVCLKVNNALGLDFNAVEIAVKDGIPYAVDFLNPLPNAEKEHLHEENFEWIVNTTAEFLISLARLGKSRSKQYNWDAFLRGPANPATKRKSNRKTF